MAQARRGRARPAVAGAQPGGNAAGCDLHELVIDEELEALIPRLSPEELAQLEQNLLAEGCREKLIAWDDGQQKRLLDGHNRLAICTRHGLPYEVECISLPDREAAIQWIVRHQLGRRNLSPEAMSYLRGRMYLVAKRQGARTDLTSGHSAQKLTTAEQIAAQYKVDEKTIRRDAKFAEQIDQLAEESGPEIKNEVLARDARIARKDVPRLLAMEKSAREQIVAGIRGGAKASVLLREPGRDGGKDTRGEQKKSDGARSGMSAALEHLEIAVSILRGLPAGSDSAEVLERLEAQVQILPKEVERHRAALQRPDTPRVDVLAVVEAVFALEREGILGRPLMTSVDALDDSKLLSWPMFITIQGYLERCTPTLERLYRFYAALRDESPRCARIYEKLDRLFKNGGRELADDSFSYVHYLRGRYADPQAYQDALRAMEQEIVEHLRALKQSVAMGYPIRKQGSLPSARPPRAPELPSTQPPKQLVDDAPFAPTPQDWPRSSASASADGAQALQPSIAVTMSAAPAVSAIPSAGPLQASASRPPPATAPFNSTPVPGAISTAMALVESAPPGVLQRAMRLAWERPSRTGVG